MEPEVEGQTGATYGEKNRERLAQRNGYRDRIWETRAGAVEHPQSCARAPISRASRSRAAWPRRRSPLWYRKVYVQGVSTRSVDDLVQAMGMTGIPTSQVSRLCGEVDDKVKAFLAGPIEGDWPYCGSTPLT